MGSGSFISNLIRNRLAADQKQLELVHKLTEKTKQGKIAWERSTNSLSASVSGTMFLNFVLSPTYPVGIQCWDLFTVRDSTTGKELLKVQNWEEVPLLGITAGPEGSPPDQLGAAARELFAAAANSARGDIEHAIELVDRL
jgi:hypothetical protein